MERKECVSDGFHPRQVGSGDEGEWGWGNWKRLGLGLLLVCLRGLEMITDCRVERQNSQPRACVLTFRGGNVDFCSLEPTNLGTVLHRCEAQRVVAHLGSVHTVADRENGLSATFGGCREPGGHI